MFDGKLESIQKRTNGSVATVETFLNKLEQAHQDADNIQDEVDEAIEELEETKEEATRVKEFVENVSGAWE